MKKPTLIALKFVTWLFCLYPAAVLIYAAVTNNMGPDPTARIELSTGNFALNLLVASLAITPLRLAWSRLSWLIKFRRLLGLFAFFYASVHMFAYVGLYAAFDPSAIVQDVLKRRFIAVGAIAWLLLVPLAITSTTGWIRRLGGKRWNQLHKLVYVAVCCGIIHYWWQVKPGVLAPMSITLIMAALFIARPILNWLKTRRQKAATA
jgi:sulfoxide reductase heme-binding subunit YedZ